MGISELMTVVPVKPGSLPLRSALLVAGAFAAAGDSVTTWANLHRPYIREGNPVMAALFASVGVTAGVVIRFAIGLALFALIGYLVGRWSGWAWRAIAGVGVAAVWITTLVVIWNVWLTAQ